MSFARRLLGLTLALLMIGAVARAQTLRSTEDPRNQAPSVTGGTGLFTVYDAQTLRRGEFNFGLYANQFHRDPADLQFQNYPFTFQVGFNDHIEIFGNFQYGQVITVGTPALLSGFYSPDVFDPGNPRTNGYPQGRVVIVPGQNVASTTLSDPCNNGGFAGPCVSGPFSGPFVARPSGNNTAVYPGLGAPVGGILAAITPNDKPSYFPGAPFLSRFSDRHMGDLWLGGKIRLTGPKSPFGFALIPIFKIPLKSDLFTALQRGRSTGAFDYGLIAAFEGRLSRHINLSTNIGFIKKGDPSADDMVLGPKCIGCGTIQGFGDSDLALDIPNEVRAAIGVDFPLTQYLQGIVEINSTLWVGSRTPNLLQNSPVDLVAGVRVWPTRFISLSAAFQRHLNWMSEFDNGTPNGVIAGFSVGHANAREEPILPNQPPTVAIEIGTITPASTDVVRTATTVCAGDQVALRATASDPDGDTLLYSWTSTGGRVAGDGSATAFDTTGLAPGEYTVTVQVDDGCGCVAFDSKTIRVESCPPLTVCFNSTLDVSADRPEVDAGEKINLTTTGVSGGRNFGNTTYNWTSSAGTISGSGQSVALDTTGVAGGTAIDVTARANSDTGNCTASGGTRVAVKAPPAPEPPKAVELGSCTTFKQGNARVDNACKDFLRNTVISALQADPQAKVVIEGYRLDIEKPETLDLERAKNTRDRLADGNLGAQVDVNRITVRPGGVTTEITQVKVWLVPSGAQDPPGAAPVDAGPVTPERKGRRR
jgi:hypothetical protein